MYNHMNPRIINTIITKIYTKNVHIHITHIYHILPGVCLPTEQRLAVGQPGVVDAHIHTGMQDPDGREHGEDLLLVGQVALIGEESSAVAGALALGRQPLKTMSQTDRSSIRAVVGRGALDERGGHESGHVRTQVLCALHLVTHN